MKLIAKHKEINNNMVKVDVVLDLSRGDCGKGKVSHALLSKSAYTHSLRYNGGGNAGHTIYHQGKKFVTHQIPAGVFYGIDSFIGPGCVINPDKLKQEIEYLESNGIKVAGKLKIAANAHVVQPWHIEDDARDTKIGTTKTGNGPCYRDKYDRVGKRAVNDPFLGPMTVDVFEEFYDTDQDCVILAEGAQGFYLDIDWGDYPLVTSSHCGIGSVLLNGFTHKQVRNVFGVAKAYETYVGAGQFEPPNDPYLSKLRELGQEYGATTGRPRQCNWLNLDELAKAALMNGVDHIILNKMDVLDSLGIWNFYQHNTLYGFNNSFQFQQHVKEVLKKKAPGVSVQFSHSPDSLALEYTLRTL